MAELEVKVWTPIPPSITEWATILKAEKALQEYLSAAEAAAAQVHVLFPATAAEKAQDVLRKGAELIPFMSELLGPAKLSLSQRDKLKKLRRLANEGDVSNLLDELFKD